MRYILSRILGILLIGVFLFTSSVQGQATGAPSSNNPPSTTSTPGSTPSGQSTMTTTECTDEKDNNEDGKIDKEDQNCIRSRGYCETMNTQCRIRIAQIDNATVTNYYNPRTSYVSNNTIGGQVVNTAGSAIVGCASGLLANLAAKGISSLLGSIGKDVPVKDINLEVTSQCLDGAAYAVAHTLLQQVTNKTLNWVNSGFNGNPLYVRDAGSYLQSIRDNKIQSFLNNSNSNSPYANAVRSAITQQVTGVSDSYFDKVSGKQYPYEFNGLFCEVDYESLFAQERETCGKDHTTSDFAYCEAQLRQKYAETSKKKCVGEQLKKINEFQSDFTKGGWDSWIDSITNDNMNPIGALFNASNDLSSQITSQQQYTQQELNRGNGFLDVKKCVQYARADRDSNETPKCLRYETTTPGSIVAQQTSSITNTTQKQLEQADKINEVLQAFFSSLLNGLLQRGLSGIGRSNDRAYSSGGGEGSNVVIDRYGNPLQGVNAGSVGVQTELYDTSSFDISRPQELRPVIEAQYAFVSAAQDTIVALRRITARLGQLDYCIPGPNRDWTSTLESNRQIFLGATAGTQNNFSALLYQGSDTYYLQDKITGQQFASRYPYRIEGGGLFQGKFNPEDAVNNFNNAYLDPTLYADTYTVLTIANFFASAFGTSLEQNYARGFAIDAVAQTQGLVSFSQNALEIQDTYTKYIKSTNDALNELESIRREVNSIVGTAKTRYIAEQKAAGTPVNLACLESAYSIDQSPIPGRPRQESDTADPIVTYSNDSSNYFYNVFLK